MKSCPVETSKAWKTLIGQTNNLLAWSTWKYYEGYPSTLTSTTALKSAMGVRNKVSDAQSIAMAKRVKAYNTKHKTSHSFDKIQVGQADIYNIEFRPNYLPYNVEKRRQRDFKRTGEDKRFYDFTNPATQGIPYTANDNHREYEELTMEEKMLLEDAIMNGSFKKENSTLTTDHWITSQTKAFKEWFGEGEAFTKDLLMYNAGNRVTQLEMFSEELEALPEDTTVKETPVLDFNKQSKINMMEAAKEGVRGGDFLSMEESEFDMLFPEYTWLDPLQKQNAVRNIMSANIKLNCGI